MRASRVIVLSVAALAVAALGDSASAAGHGAHGGHGGGHSGGHHFHHFGGGVFIAAPFFFYPRYAYPAPYYDYPPYDYAPPAPTYYIEQPQAGYWHYCPSARAYYPQVQTCPGGWQLVAPQPRSGY